MLTWNHFIPGNVTEIEPLMHGEEIVMWKTRSNTLLFLVVILSLLLPAPAYADGIIIPEPPICDPGPCPTPTPMNQLSIVYHHVDVRIEGQVAITHVDQVFRNDQDWEIEGTYVFPIPVDAVVDDFTLWMDGQPVEGTVLSREEARQTYEDIVQQMRDPALLEYVDRGAVQASIYPIPPGGTRRIELEYAQILPVEDGLVHYIYPLNTEKFSALPLETVRVTVNAVSDIPIHAVYSPSHPIDILRADDVSFTASYEAADITPDTDFDLYYSVSTEDIDMSVITYREPQGQDPDGYFLLLAAPGVEVNPERTVARDVFLVLDQSGSMDGEKFQQAQEALAYILRNLNPQDRFNIISFSTGTCTYADRLQPASNTEDAIRWVQSLSARGSTDINRALLETFAQADAERSTLVIFLTDGLPTEGVIEREDILANLRQAAPSNLRLFSFGVGYDVDTYLLDAMAQENHGRSAYVEPGDALDEIVSGFYTTISTPVMTDVHIDFGEMIVYDLYPSPLPDLFAGQQIILMGRYREGGSATLDISGLVQDEEQSFTYQDIAFHRYGGQALLPRLWATRKIGALLNEVRLSGPDEELVAQIVALSIRFGIVTPYTSYLVTEENALSEEAREGIAAEAYADMLAAPTAVSGAGAVERAQAESLLSDAEAAVPLVDEAANLIRQVGARTFALQDGAWVDTRFNPDTMETIHIPFLSEDYFQLLETYPELGASLALGDRVIVCVGDAIYEIVAADADGDTLYLPTPSPSGDAPEETMPANESLSQESPLPGLACLRLPAAVLILIGALLLRRVLPD